MVTGYLTGINRPGRGVEHLVTLSAEVNQKVELHFYAPSGPAWPFYGELYFLPFNRRAGRKQEEVWINI
jgi:hypothetical protein